MQTFNTQLTLPPVQQIANVTANHWRCEKVRLNKRSLYIEGKLTILVPL
jgi:hypothetical protein